MYGMNELFVNFLSHLRKGDGVLLLFWFGFDFCFVILVKPASSSPPFPFRHYTNLLKHLMRKIKLLI